MTDLNNKQHTEAELVELLGKHIADDLNLLSALQRTEITAQTLQALIDNDFPNSLGLTLIGPASEDALDCMKKAMQSLSNNHDEKIFDQLAVDFSNIYLLHTYQASPYESVWLDEEQLMQQQPMFDIRKCYEKHGLFSQDKDVHADHLCLQLEFIAYLLSKATDKSALIEAGEFMDHHILRWVKPFSARIVKYGHTEFYAGLVLLMAVYLDQLRELLVELTGEPIVVVAEEKQDPTEHAVELQPYVPGAEPSW